MIVVDANIVAFYLVRGERTARAQALRDADAEWIVPAFWCVEFQNILWKYSRFGGMPMAKALELLEQAVAMFSGNEMTPAPDTVLRDSITWGITAYDAQYASLARQMGVRFVTDDGAVQEACPSVAVSIEDFLRDKPSAGMVREKAAAYRTRRRR